MKIVSWNVNGIRAVLSKGTLTQLASKEHPDIICLQETKAHPNQVHDIFKEYPYQFWNSAEKKGYAGTAVFSKTKPLDVKYGPEKEPHRGEGRVISLEFADFHLVTVYTPNSGEGLRRLEYRKAWDEQFLAYLKKLDNQKPLILCGDLNVAHTPIDLSNPKENYDITAGYTQTEIDGFQNMLHSGFIDTFRQFNQQPGNYSYWTYRFNCREKNIGWRLDYFLVSSSLKNKLRNSWILKEVLGSDHCPVGVELE